MKTRKLAILLQLTLLSILVACHKQDAIDYPDAVKLAALTYSKSTNDIDTLRLMMPATYDWIETKVGDRNWSQYSNPFTEHKTRRYIFRADSSVQFYENGRLRWSNKYMVDHEMPRGSLQITPTIVRIVDKTRDSTIEYFYPYLSNDSASFSYLPYANSLFRRR